MIDDRWYSVVLATESAMMTRRPELDRRTPMWPPLIIHKTSCSPVAESLHSAMASSILARFLLLSPSSDSCKWLKFSEGKLRTFDPPFYLYTLPIGEPAQNAYESLGCSASQLKWPIFNSTTSKDHSYFCSSIDTVIAVYGFLSWVTVSLSRLSNKHQAQAILLSNSLSLS